MQDDPINFYQSMISIDLTTMLRYATLPNRPQKPVGRSLFIAPKAKKLHTKPGSKRKLSQSKRVKVKVPQSLHHLSSIVHHRPADKAVRKRKG
jgi:hypothetical protein